MSVRIKELIVQSILPQHDKTYNLGSSSLRFNKGHFYNLEVSGITTTDYQLFTAGNKSSAHLSIVADGINAWSDAEKSNTLFLNYKGGPVQVGASAVDTALFKVFGFANISKALRVDGQIFGYVYNRSNNAPAFVLDKNGSNCAGIGSCNTNNTILFGPCTSSSFSSESMSFEWVDDNNSFTWKYHGNVLAYRNDDAEVSNGVYYDQEKGYCLFLYGNSVKKSRGLWDSTLQKNLLQFNDTANNVSFNGGLYSQKTLTTPDELDRFILNNSLLFGFADDGSVPENFTDGSIISLCHSDWYGAQIWIDDGSGERGMAVRSSGGLDPTTKNKPKWNPWRKIITDIGGTITGNLGINGDLTVGDDITLNGTLIAKDGVFSYYQDASNSEADNGVTYNGGHFFMWGNSSGTRGLWDSKVGKVLGIDTNGNISLVGNAATATTLSATLAIDKGGTGATTKSGAAANLLAYSTSNGNFNEKTAIGWYWTQLKSCTNTPLGDNIEGVYGFLEVVDAWGNSGEPLQRWTNYYNGDTWVRTGINQWNAWARYLTTNNYSLYALPLTGGELTGKLTVKAPIVGYNYVNNNNEPAFIWDKPGSHWTGMGSNGSVDTIHFGPCTADSTTGRYTWVSNYDQYWHFQGSIEATKTIYATKMWAKASDGEADMGVGYASGKYLFFYGNSSSGGRGIWDSTAGHILYVSDNGAYFYGAAAGADALTTSSAGSTYKPVYFSGGKPVACEGVLPVYYNSSWNCNTIYDASIYLISAGTNCPSGSQYGMVLTLPYRKQQGNGDSDYGAQIFLPNGDDSVTPDGMFYRTSLHEYRGWKSVVHSSQKEYFSGNNPNSAGYSGTKGDVYFQIVT